jgi:hypothetical protein
MNRLIIDSVSVTGFTEWESTEYRSVGRFRGTGTKVCKVRDDKGRHAQRASRGLKFLVFCADGTVYRFRTYLDEFMTEHVNGLGTVDCVLVVHGMIHDIKADNAPETVLSAYREASRAMRAALRLRRDDVLALPKYRPIAD